MLMNALDFRPDSIAGLLAERLLVGMSGAVTGGPEGDKPKTRKPRAPNSAPAALAVPGQMPRGAKNSDIVYWDLRSEIVSMALPPGTTISEKDLAQKYGISRTPVREAVLRLADDQLVDVVVKSGTFVSRISISGLREAIVVRRALEAVTVQEATERATESQIMELRALIQRQAEIAAADDFEAFHKADEDFHAGLAHIGGYPGIWDLIQQVKVNVDRYRRLTLPQPGRLSLIVEEHGAVVDAIATRDAATAVERMNDHLNKLRLDISIFQDMWPDYFIHDLPLDRALFA